MRIAIAIGLAVAVSSAAAAPVVVSVDATANVHPFSPLIFGVAFGDATRNAQIGYTVIRWGGNSTTRYNWQFDLHNTANDFYFENVPGSRDRTHIPPLGNSADAFITDARSGGAFPLIAIPTIGVKPLDGSALDHPLTVGFAVAKYGGQQKVDTQYDPNAGNGKHTDGSLITGNDASDTSDAAPPSYEASWIAHLQSVFGTAANGGVKYYSLDNEVMLWNSTHRDVHPDPLTYDQLWNNTVAYATAIKAAEPDAVVTGFVTWGYPDLFTSAADAASCTCFAGSDRSAHGGLPLVQWYLQQVHAHPMSNGKPLVDYLDLHYYPQDPNGSATQIYSQNDNNDPATSARRLRSLKELYDPNWTSESWIGTVDGPDGDDPDWHYTKPNLIPRVKAWINEFAPGTKLAITEYAWDDHGATDSGAVAQAELLGIFAREGVDLATRWTAPATNSLGERAFRLFLNYDGAGAKVTGDSVGATTSNIDQIGAYAFHGGDRLMVLLTNKDTVAHDVTVTLNAARNATWMLYGFDASHNVHLIAPGSITTNKVTLTGLTAMSANLLVIPDNDEIFGDDFE
jgi:Glycoside hydrolase family 44